jgi:hypothetical protein
MNSSAFCCAVSGSALQPVGKSASGSSAPAATWMLLRTTRPQTAVSSAPIGALNDMYWTGLSFGAATVPLFAVIQLSAFVLTPLML